MKLCKLIKILEEKNLLVDVKGKKDLEVFSLTYDSREVKKDSLFICKGLSFKEAYLKVAKESGALAYLSEKDYGDEALMAIIVNDIRLAMAVLSDLFYDSPWKSVPLIGVTGTKGKSSTTMFLEAILNEAYKPKKVGLTSSLRVYDGKVDKVATLTTPESLDLFSYLSNARETGLPAMLVEVSSQALKYHRTKELVFSHGIFLNIGKDHISPIEHPDFEDYFKSKCLFFAQCKKAYVNLDCKHLEDILEAAKKSEALITFSLEKESDYRAYDLKEIEGGLSFKVKAKAYDAPFFIGVTGEFNVSNALSAIAVATEMGLPFEVIQAGLKKARLVGRMEVIEKTSTSPKIIVDYAHNKLSFESVLSSSQKTNEGKLWVVFGAPGGKAKNRRVDLGEVASLYADKIVLTTDDAFDEAPQSIAKEIESGYKRAVESIFIEDRKEAISYAITHADVSDMVLLLGKGAERTQKMKEGAIPYEGDYENAIFACAKRGNGL